MRGTTEVESTEHACIIFQQALNLLQELLFEVKKKMHYVLKKIGRHSELLGSKEKFEEFFYQYLSNKKGYTKDDIVFTRKQKNPDFKISILE